MIKSILVFLTDIITCIEKIEAYTEGMSKDEFIEDDEAQDAVIRRVEIIGEAAKNIPDNFKKAHPDAPWAEMARTRDKLIHGYFDVNAERV
ncbi:Uncharacterised protein [uncultured archaeon]|nr:Uncharacterised protein [uncultured archaeon]